MKQLFVSTLAFAVGFLTTTSTRAQAQFPESDEIVEFHIPAGTGDKAWNTLANPIMVKRGQILRLINDDSIEHFLHTNGAPCPHGSHAFKTGEFYDCAITRVHNASAGDTYDHDQGPDAQVFIQAD
jgi:hypothetical protein